jgi:predicted O-methyltransferase YrrM
MMDGEMLKALSDFIQKLTGRDLSEIQGYVSEIDSNRVFHDQLNVKRNSPGGQARRHSDWGISDTLGTVLYSICRLQKPGIVVETGVCGGVSSSYILCALAENQSGELYSIDLKPLSGWLIPEHLKSRWHFITGAASQELASLLEKTGPIDLFLHDSEHTYRNMLWEFQIAWQHLKAGGLLLSHNIDYNKAFPDFCRRTGVKAQTYSDFGGIIKPG